MELIILLVIALPCGFALLPSVVAYRWAMSPVYHLAAVRPSRRMRFSIADFLCLFVQAQQFLPVFVVVLQAGERSFPEAFAKIGTPIIYSSAIVLLVVALNITWWSSVQLLNLAEISSIRSRVTMLTLISPVCLVCSVVLGVCLGVLLLSLLATLYLARIVRDFSSVLILALVTAIAMYLALLALHNAVLAIANRTKRERKSYGQTSGHHNATS